jgi:hypothetical protein
MRAAAIRLSSVAARMNSSGAQIVRYFDEYETKICTCCSVPVHFVGAIAAGDRLP